MLDASETWQWLAHRGDTENYPENTWPALEAAMQGGITSIEFDLQVSRDGVPVLLHDLNLQRTAGANIDATTLDADVLRQVDVGEFERLGHAYQPTMIITLAEAVERLTDWSDVHCFVEIKSESGEVHGIDTITRRVVDEIGPILGHATVISFSERVVLTARRAGAPLVGWCLDYYDEDAQRLADAIAPDVLLCAQQDLLGTEAPLWPGPWEWASWEVRDLALARRLIDKGVTYIESMHCLRLEAERRAAT